MRKRASFIVFAFIFSLPAVAMAQSADVAFYAIKKMEARMKTGLSTGDYQRALRETRSSVSAYLRGPEAGENAERSMLTERILKSFEDIGVVRKEILKGPYRYLDPLKVGFYRAKPIVKARYFLELLERYPEANRFIEAGGALDRDASDKGRDLKDLKYGPVLNLSHLLPIMERRCRQDTERLSGIFMRSLAEAESGKSEIVKLLEENRLLKEENMKLRNELESLKKDPPRESGVSGEAR